MHYHLEIITPPTDDVKAAIEQILAPFDENLDRGDEDANGHPFWDWWVIGGRWSGSKMNHALGKEAMDAFEAGLAERKITVAGFRAGKPTLAPPEQAELVNRLWNEAFPEAPVKVCPLFDNYTGDVGDVMTVADAPPSLPCSHLIIAGPGYRAGTLEAQTMLMEEIWNGVTHQATTWDGTLGGGLAEHTKRHASYRAEWLANHTPGPDWLVVTVDYHS